MKHRILKWLSKLLPVKVPAGKSVTTTTVDNKPLESKKVQPQKLVQAITVNNKPLDNKPLFFKPKADLGTLEYRGTDAATQMHVLEDIKTGELYRLDLAALQGMFKGVIVNYVPPKPPTENTTEQ